MTTAIPSEFTGGKPGHDADFAAGFHTGTEAFRTDDRVDASTAKRAYDAVSRTHGLWWVNGYCAAIDYARGAYATRNVRIAIALGLV